MTGENVELLPILTVDDDGEAVYLCGACKRRWGFDSLARACALEDAALAEWFPAAHDVVSVTT